MKNFAEFVTQLLDCGFSMGGGNAEGIFALVPYTWDHMPEDAIIRWHTGDAETDPWEWRMRVLDERDDIAYGKLFFKKSGFITRAWYPYFLAARRAGQSFEEAYADGTISHEAKRIYQVVAEHGALPLHAIKALAQFSKEDKSAFDRAITELQMKLYLTMCGRARKRSRVGEEYGWSSTVFCTSEEFWDEAVFEQARAYSPEEAEAAIMAQIRRLNPEVAEKKARKFIYGM